MALCQLWLAHAVKLSAWSGGGFGMFSTADVWARRHFHATLEMPGALRELAIPVELRMQAREAMALPSDARLRALAEALAATAGEPGDRVSLTLYAKRFDRDTLAPSGEPLKSVRVELRDGAR